MVVLISGLIGTVTITLIRGGDRNVRLDNDYSANGRLDRSHSIRLPDGAAREVKCHGCGTAARVPPI